MVRDGVLYLVCTLWDYDDLKQVVLHRMTSAELLDTPVKKAEGFDLVLAGKSVVQVPDHPRIRHVGFISEEEQVGALRQCRLLVILHDTRTPLRMSLTRVGVSTILGYVAAVHLPPVIGVEPRYGAVALTGVAGAAGQLEILLLRNRLERRIGAVRLPAGMPGRLLLASAAGGLAGTGADWMLALDQPVLRALAALLPFVAVYLAATHLLGPKEAASLIRRFGGN